MNANEQFRDKELAVLLRELNRAITATAAGDVVEMGCYKGATSVELQKAIGKLRPEKKLYLYDSFAGLPDKGSEDSSPAGMQFRAGELPASKSEVIRRFKQASLPLPIIRKSWFSDLTSKDMPARIAFAFLDGDFYESIMDSLKLIWPLLTNGATVVVDDYQNEALPGAQKAVDSWLKSHPASLTHETSLAIIKL